MKLMQEVTRQLEQVRRRGRLMLVAQRLCQWLGVLGPIVLVLALLDYALRLPGAAAAGAGAGGAGRRGDLAGRAAVPGVAVHPQPA